MEGARHYGKLRQLGKRLNAWNDGDGDAIGACFLYKVEVFLVIVEQLCDGIFGTKILFHLQIVHIHLQVWRLFVFLGVGGHTKMEWLAWMLDGGSVNKEALVKAIYLLYELCGVLVSARCSLESAVFFSLVTTQQ